MPVSEKQERLFSLELYAKDLLARIMGSTIGGFADVENG